MPQPESAPPSRPPLPASVQDLSDAEFAELDGILADIPEPLDPLDVVMLDGFLAGVLVQPERVEPERWLPYVFDSGGHRWGEAVPDAPQERARALILRRFGAMNRELAEFGQFDPLILELDDEVSPAASVVADDEPLASTSPQGAADELPADPVVGAVLPWVAGFEFAASLFPALYELDDDAVGSALTRLYRFLPAETEEEKEVGALLDRERPVATLDAAIAELMDSVADLYDLTAPRRYKVETVRRDQPKVGRNEPCPCGSGKKFKQCHGAGA